MAKFGFTKLTYEVFAMRDGRWSLESVCQGKSEAMALAEQVQGKAGVGGVRVTAVDESKGKEEVIHEDLQGESQSLKPVSVDTVPLCHKPGDVYEFPARRTMGRVLRQYLDSQGVTALELLFDAGKLNMLERMDSFFPSAMSMAAGVQAKTSGLKPADCSDALYASFARIRDFARENKKTFDADAETIALGGLGAMLARRSDKAQQLGALATYMGRAGDWGDKLALLLALADAQPGPHGIDLLDGAVAEIMDGAQAVKDILAGQRDTGSALMGLAQLAQGRYRPDKIAGPALVALAERLKDLGWQKTRSILFERVARGLGGPAKVATKTAKRSFVWSAKAWILMVWAAARSWPMRWCCGPRSLCAMVVKTSPWKARLNRFCI